MGVLYPSHILRRYMGIPIFLHGRDKLRPSNSGYRSRDESGGRERERSLERFIKRRIPRRIPRAPTLNNHEVILAKALRGRQASALHDAHVWLGATYRRVRAPYLQAPLFQICVGLAYSRLGVHLPAIYSVSVVERMGLYVDRDESMCQIV